MSLPADLRAVVRGRDFRRLYATRLTAQAADGMGTVALASFVFFSPERATTAAGTAGAFAVLLLPFSVVGPFAGVLLDRWRRRQVLVVASLLRAALLVALAVLVAGGHAGAGLYAVGLAVLSTNRFFLSALSAALPHVVARADLVMANSVSTTSGTLASVAGAAAAFVLRRGLSGGDRASAVILLLSAGTAVAAALLATRMPRDLLGPDRTGPARTRAALRSTVGGLADGARHVRARRPAARALGVIAAHRFVYGLSTIATILLYRNSFAASTGTEAALRGLGAVVVASGAGFLVAAAVTPEVTRRWSPEGWIVACFAGAAVTEAAYVVGPLTPLTLPAGAFVVGLAAQGSKICIDAIVQAAVDDAYRGRVFSFYDVLFNVSFVFAAAVAALVVPASGYSRPLYAALALGYAVAGLSYGRATARGRRSAVTVS